MFRIAFRETWDQKGQKTTVVVLYCTSEDELRRLRRRPASKPSSEFELLRELLLQELMDSGVAVLANWGPGWRLSSVFAVLVPELSIQSSKKRLDKAHTLMLGA